MQLCCAICSDQLQGLSKWQNLADRVVPFVHWVTKWYVKDKRMYVRTYVRTCAYVAFLFQLLNGNVRNRCISTHQSTRGCCAVERCAWFVALCNLLLCN